MAWLDVVFQFTRAAVTVCLRIPANFAAECGSPAIGMAACQVALCVKNRLAALLGLAVLLTMAALVALVALVAHGLVALGARLALSD